ncbi:MAG: diacylglycerol kinase [Sulfuricurvum sp.]
MALNKPEYTLFKNTRYALNGLFEVTRNEKSFRLQLLLFAVASVVAWVLPVTFYHHAVLFISLFIPIMSEIANSAIERGVDLVTLEHHELAKRAKDAGAALVFVSFVVLACIWTMTLYDAWCL